MKSYIKLSIPLFALLITGCKKPDPKYQCEIPTQTSFSNHAEALEAYATSDLLQLYNSKGPDATGALGRNKEGYFHVRFQLEMGFTAFHAVKSQSTVVLDEFIKTLEYSYDYQVSNGNFQLIVPADLSSLPPASDADSASGVAFFLSSVGNSILTLTNSNWYQTLSDTTFSHRINELKPDIELSLEWLMTKADVLESADAEAPNRLLFDALAYYTLGEWLDNAAAKNLGISFIEKALAMQDPKGYYYELGGWDSSYQGVGVFNGLNLILAINNSSTIHNDLWSSVACGADWQKSRVLKSGEISLKDNTRVFEGGEEFLGEEKGIAWLDTYLSFQLMSYLTSDQDYTEKASEVRGYYE